MRFLILVGILFLATTLASNKVQAMNLDWSGVYRFEWVEVDKPTLGTPSDRKAYGLNYLSLSPKIIGSDGFNVISKIIMLPSTDPVYSNSQVGQLWGSGFQAPTSTAGSNSFSHNKAYSNVLVSQLYLNINQEYGSILLGRAPFEFGMGITHNAGNGVFDHWSDIHDIAAYKFIVDNWSFMPAIGRPYDTDPSQGGNISEQIIQLQYQNDESGSLIGYLREERRGGIDSNDANAGPVFNGYTRTGGVNVQRTNLILGRKWESFEFKMEAGFQAGDTGLANTTGENVSFNGYGIAVEMYMPRLESKWDYNFRFGVATGDDPSTAAFEGYQFNRNYDVAFLLFNHRLGQYDLLSTGINKDPVRTTSNSYDDEAIGNTLYFSPLVGFKYNDQLDIYNAVTLAQLMTNTSGQSGFTKDLGVEWDIKLVYKHTANIQWINQIGFLSPGAGFKNGNANLENSSTYGFESKAAISF